VIRARIHSIRSLLYDECIVKSGANVASAEGDAHRRAPELTEGRVSDTLLPPGLSSGCDCLWIMRILLIESIIESRFTVYMNVLLPSAPHHFSLQASGSMELGARLYDISMLIGKSANSNSLKWCPKRKKGESTPVVHSESNLNRFYFQRKHRTGPPRWNINILAC